PDLPMCPLCCSTGRQPRGGGTPREKNKIRHYTKGSSGVSVILFRPYSGTFLCTGAVRCANFDRFTGEFHKNKKIFPVKPTRERDDHTNPSTVNRNQNFRAPISRFLSSYLWKQDLEPLTFSDRIARTICIKTVQWKNAGGNNATIRYDQGGWNGFYKVRQQACLRLQAIPGRFGCFSEKGVKTFKESNKLKKFKIVRNFQRN
ncbi:unnamed protein product, partial [Nesidiocoris tenuis]